MPGDSKAVFLSYASEDAKAAGRIAEGLRTAGIEVWFDQAELRGGDAWDRQIRQQIHDCRLFVPIVSANTDARVEGYFRREWRLAVDRTHDLSDRVPFLVPVAIDSISEQGADVPDAFRHVQWTRMPGGETPLKFIERVQRLLSPQPPETATGARQVTVLAGSRPASSPPPTARTFGPKAISQAIVAVVAAAAIAYFTFGRFSVLHEHTPSTASLAVPANSAPAVFAPPPHSVAVLPFVNMSGDPKQEYFSDGMTEEILNSLTRVNELQVAARTSSFSFKGTNTDIATIARKLDVGAILEGSIRRSGQTVRITAQLINAVTGFHLWSQTYDRHLRDVLQLQTEIANAVASALKVTLLNDLAAKIEVGGTRNPEALDAYLRGLKEYWVATDAAGFRDAIAAYTEAINLDSNYALAFAGRSMAHSAFADNSADPAPKLEKAKQDARRAIALAPTLAEAHIALAKFQFETLDIAGAGEEFDYAIKLAPGNARVLGAWGRFAVSIGHFDEGIAAARHALALDPLNPVNFLTLGNLLLDARRPTEALALFQEAAHLAPESPDPPIGRAMTFFALGNVAAARALCESKRNDWRSYVCLALAYHRLGMQKDAEAMLGKLKSVAGNDGAYAYSNIYAQWGDIPGALSWLETAYRQRDTDLLYLKTDPLMDPLRQEPRFQVILKALKIPG